MKTYTIAIQTKDNNQVFIQKKRTDPLCMRASIGGSAEKGYYCTFRADNIDQVEEMLTTVLEAFKLHNSAKKQEENNNN